MVSPRYDNKEIVVITMICDQILSDAMRTLKFCEKSLKNRDASNKINQEFNVSEASGMSKIIKSSRSINFHSVSNKSSRVQSSQDMSKINKNNNTINIYSIIYSRIYSIFTAIFTVLLRYLSKITQDDACVINNAFKISNVCSLNDTKDKKRDKKPKKNSEGLKKENNKKFNKKDEKENNDKFKNDSGYQNEEDNKEQQGEPEESMDKDKEEINQYNVNTAAGKAKRRQSNKHSSILTWHLISKNGTRAVLSQKEREKPKLKGMKKHRTKTEPSVLREPRVMPKVVKKPANTCSATQPESLGEIVCAISLLQRENLPPPASHDKTLFRLKNTVPQITVTNFEDIVEHQTKKLFGVSEENSIVKSMTRVQPFSFEARDKDLHIKKQQRLKSLQEANNAKVEFRARPMLNFSKPPKSAIVKQKALKEKIHPSELNVDKRTKGLREFERNFEFFKNMEEEAMRQKKNKK